MYVYIQAATQADRELNSPSLVSATGADPEVGGSSPYHLDSHGSPPSPVQILRRRKFLERRRRKERRKERRGP